MGDAGLRALLEDEEPFGWDRFGRLAAWAALAIVSVLAVAIAARTEAGSRRLAASRLKSPSAEAVRVAPVPTAPMAANTFNSEVEARRLSEAVRLLAADRDRLLARISALEHNLDDVTGSIGPAKAMGEASSSSAQPSLPAQKPETAAVSITMSPPTAPPGEPAAPAEPVKSAPDVAAGKTARDGAAPARIAAAHNAAVPTNGSESVATKTEFGIDIGGDVSISALRTLWTTTKSGYPALLEGLRPVVAIRENGAGGKVELRLIAGPLANAATAARLCAALTAAGRACEATVFDGQRLALK
jgi:hypothetical protein